MPWFRLDDGFYDNPKVTRAGNAAIGLWVRCATWSARQLTDGHIPTNIVRTLGKPSEAAALTRSGLWTLDGDEYVMPDYLDYNPSANEVKQRRKTDSERRRRGGQTRASDARRNEHGQFLPTDPTRW